jgi:hypothetical protein
MDQTLSEERARLAELKFQLLSAVREWKFQRLVRVIKVGFNPDQPRDKRGRWSDGSEGLNDTRVLSDEMIDG